MARHVEKDLHKTSKSKDNLKKIQIHKSNNDGRSNADLHVAPLGDALPAEEVSAGSARGVPPLLQAQDAPSHSGSGAVRLLGAATHTERESSTIGH